MKEWFTTYKKVIMSTLIIATILLISVSLVYGFISEKIPNFFDRFFKVISPITIGFVIAYLSNPIAMFFERKLFKGISKFYIKRLISVLLTFALIILIISFIITMIIPNLISTLETFWNNYIVNYRETLTELTNNINSILDEIKFLNKIDRINAENLINWTQTNLPWIDSVVDGDFSSFFANAETSLNQIFGIALNFSSSLFSIIKNIVLGLFIAGYMLMAKENVKAYIRRFLCSFMSPKAERNCIRFAKLIDRTLGGFIEGQLIDAGVVGIICYVVFSIFKLPVPLLLSCIIAVTNVIPIFGPFIGGIPAAFLVLITNPSKLLLFIILIVIIQQIDGNIICPHILGDRIKISSLATIIAIITMGGLFGILGMVIGVPVFAVAIHIINHYTTTSLRKKGLETSIDHYYVNNTERTTNKQSKSIKDRLKLSLNNRKHKKEK